MANKSIGELEVEINEKKFLLRGTFKALNEIEDKASCDVMTIASDISKGKISAKKVIAVLWGGVYGSGERGLTFEDFSEECVRHGVLSLAGPAAIFLSQSLVGEKKRAEMTSQSPTTTATV